MTGKVLDGTTKEPIEGAVLNIEAVEGKTYLTFD
jgi:hypothetical protein